MAHIDLNGQCRQLTVAGRARVHSLLQLSERWPCHIRSIDMMKVAPLEANLDGDWGLFSPSHSTFLSPSLWEESQHD